MQRFCIAIKIILRYFIANLLPINLHIENNKNDLLLAQIPHFKNSLFAINKYYIFKKKKLKKIKRLIT